MEIGVYIERDRDEDDVVLQAAAVLAGDGRKEMCGVEKEVEEVEEGQGEEEEEDVYSMDVSDELDKRKVSARTHEAAVVVPELDMNDPPKEEDVPITSLSINIGAGSESAAETEMAPAASGKEDVRDLNEAPTAELENENEGVATIVNVASPMAESTPVERDFLRAVEAPEVAREEGAASGQEEAAKAEVMERAAISLTLDVNEPPEAVKMAEEEPHPEVAAFRIVKAEEAKSLHDVEDKMVGYTPGGEVELFRAAVQRESEPEVAANESEKPEPASEPSGSVAPAPAPATSVDMDMVDARADGVAPKAERTELEREMELFEAAEREEQARLLGPMRVEQAREESQNEKKRALDTPMAGRQRKVSRKMHAGEERKKDEEDVCFICFDGGDLVLCDRRSCPKAYHLSCIGRDAAFFKKKGAWLCGWHFCSVCTKPGNFQCYTCPTAYCGSCITKAEFLLLRKRKGLCEDCLPIVSMIERNETINADGVEVDFEDQETYECLFKEYWVELKRKLALVMPELDKDGKAVGGNGNVLRELELGGDDPSENDESDREMSDESEHDDPEATDEARKKRKVAKNRMGSEKMEEDVVAEEVDDEEEEEEEEGEGGAAGAGAQKFESWASEELLEFISHMGEDPVQPMSRFAVNKLLWSYIKEQKLQDSRQSSQINCDERLKRIFGKDSMGQLELFKHLQEHFPSRISAVGKKSKDAAGSGEEAVVDADAGVAEGVEDKVDSSGGKERRRGRKVVDEKFERPNGSEYAAITPKNIGLIYLRRALLRDLLDDPEFDNKVVDTFVRIRVPGISTKTETTYRLVLVTGTRIGEESYKAGTKMTNIVLEILNLQKKEDVTVDLVSNQDFTEEECQRLRQSMKCGFIKAPTVGQLEDKAIALQEARVNDWFENERQRLINLRDRASEKGRKKELRECVEKLQELSSPAFRAAKLQARPEVAADPHMDPNYESDANEKSPLHGGSQRFRGKSSLWEKGGGSTVSTWDSFNPDESGYSGRKVDFENSRPKPLWEETGRSSSRGYGRGGYEGGRGREKLGYGVGGRSFGNDDRDKVRVWDKDWERDPPPREVERTRGEGYNWNGRGGDVDQWGGELIDSKYGRGEARAATTPVFGQPRTEWGGSRREAAPSLGVSGPADGYGVTSPGLSVQSLAALEKEKLWHYKDPTGTVQGPFSMEQLRKWNTTGLFPVHLTIWKAGGSMENSMLLTDALAGRLKEEVLGAPRNRSREYGSPSGRGGASWGAGDVAASRVEVVGSADWESRDAGRWERGQSGYGSAPSNTSRADDWSGSRSRAEPDTWGSSRKGSDGASWVAGESGKSTFGRSSSGRDYDGLSGRDGPRSSRTPRGSRKDVPCRFYAKGYCKRGDTCEFWHG